MIFKSTLLSLLLLLFFGCSSKVEELYLEKKDTSSSLPSWYISPPNNDALYLYGLGEGENMAEAQRSALENLASRISVKISSEIELHEESYRDLREYVTKNSSQSIKSEVEKIAILGYETIQSQELSYSRLALLIRVQKRNVVDSMRGEVERVHERIVEKNLIVNNSNPLSKYIFYKESINSLQNAIPKLTLLKTLDFSFDEAPYLESLSKMQSNLERLKNSMTFSINTNKKSRLFSNIIGTTLHRDGFKIVEDGIESPSNLKIEIELDIVPTNPYGINIAMIALTLKIVDNNLKSLGGSSFQIKGASSQGYEAAVQNGAKKFGDLLKNEDINILFGVDRGR